MKTDKRNPSNPHFGCGSCSSLSMEGIDKGSFKPSKKENKKESLYKESEKTSSKVISLF